MDDGYIRGHRMTDVESEIFLMCESDRAFQKAVDAFLNEIDSLSLSKEDIKQMFKDGRYIIKYDSLCN